MDVVCWLGMLCGSLWGPGEWKEQGEQSAGQVIRSARWLSPREREERLRSAMKREAQLRALRNRTVDPEVREDREAALGRIEPEQGLFLFISQPIGARLFLYGNWFPCKGDPGERCVCDITWLWTTGDAVLHSTPESCIERTDPRFAPVLQRSLQIRLSDCPPREKGRQLLGLLQPWMTFEQVHALFGESEAVVFDIFPCGRIAYCDYSVVVDIRNGCYSKGVCVEGTDSISLGFWEARNLMAVIPSREEPVRSGPGFGTTF
jgi:hypothetical protein